jgi:hypothetical protein
MRYELTDNEWIAIKPSAAGGTAGSDPRGLAATSSPRLRSAAQTAAGSRLTIGARNRAAL